MTASRGPSSGWNRTAWYRRDGAGQNRKVKRSHSPSTNARTPSPSATKPHGVSATEVTLRYEEKPDHLTLFIEDNGVGIPAEEKNMIFDRGYGKGTGLGLFLVREVLSITGMTIKETGMSKRGTRFEITVPKRMYHYPTG